MNIRETLRRLGFYRASYVTETAMPRILRPHLRWEAKAAANDHDNAPSVA